MAHPVNLWLSLRFGQLEVNMSADDVHGYAPDVANDIAKHVLHSFTEAIGELRAHGVLGMSQDDDEGDEEEGEAEDA
ncbi:MAG: hypothetical protein ABFD94_14045 [Armatimonadia bacterium]